MQAQLNTLQLFPKFRELDRPCPIEIMLMSQMIPFMSIAAKTIDGQHGFKGEFDSVPTDLKKIHTILSRSCNEENLISLD